MTQFNNLQELFANGDFLVQVSFNSNKATRAVSVFETAKDAGIKFDIKDYFDDTWMGDFSDDGFGLDNWGYLGICNNVTVICDDNTWDCVELTLHQFESLAMTTTQATESDTAPLVITGGIVVVTYKTGKQYHLNVEGKATLDVINRQVVTEHFFLKDGQKAYERVEVKLDVLDTVEADNTKLTVLDDSRVAFTNILTL